MPFLQHDDPGNALILGSSPLFFWCRYQLAFSGLYSTYAALIDFVSLITLVSSLTSSRLQGPKERRNMPGLTSRANHFDCLHPLTVARVATRMGLISQRRGKVVG